MTTQALVPAQVVGLVYAIVVLLYFLFSLHKLAKLAQFLKHEYSPGTTRCLTLHDKIHSDQWTRFLGHVLHPASVKPCDLDSDSNNELNPAARAFSPGTFRDWLSSLFFSYHPFGLPYLLCTSRPIPLSANIALCLTAVCHVVLCLVYGIVLSAVAEDEAVVDLKYWLSYTIPSAAALLVVLYACILLLRSTIKRTVVGVMRVLGPGQVRELDKGGDCSNRSVSAIPRKDSTADFFLRAGPNHDKKPPENSNPGMATLASASAGSCSTQLAELNIHNPQPAQPVGADGCNGKQEDKNKQTTKKRGWAGVLFLCGGLCGALSMSYVMASCELWLPPAAINYLTTMGISWALDVVVLRPGLILLLAIVFSRGRNTHPELKAFELWCVPREGLRSQGDKRENGGKELPRPDAPGQGQSDGEVQIGAGSGSCGEGPKDWAGASINDRKMSTDVMSLGDESRTDGRSTELMLEHPLGDEGKNRLDTVRDDIEGENLASVNSPPKPRTHFHVLTGDKEKGREKNQEHDQQNEDEKEKEKEKAERDNSSVDARAKMLWGFQDVVSSKQTSPLKSQRVDASNRASKYQSPDKALSPFAGHGGRENVEVSFGMAIQDRMPGSKLSPIASCSPLKQSKNMNMSIHDQIADAESPAKSSVSKTSPKKGKRTFVPEDPVPPEAIRRVSPGREKLADPELKELLHNIKESVSFGKPRQDLMQLSSAVPGKEPAETVRDEEADLPNASHAPSSSYFKPAPAEISVSKLHLNLKPVAEAPLNPPHNLNLEPTPAPEAELRGEAYPGPEDEDGNENEDEDEDEDEDEEIRAGAEAEPKVHDAPGTDTAAVAVEVGANKLRMGRNSPSNVEAHINTNTNTNNKDVQTKADVPTRKQDSQRQTKGESPSRQSRQPIGMHGSDMNNSIVVIEEPVPRPHAEELVAEHKGQGRESEREDDSKMGESLLFKRCADTNGMPKQVPIFGRQSTITVSGSNAHTLLVESIVDLKSRLPATTKVDHLPPVSRAQESLPPLPASRQSGPEPEPENVNDSETGPGALRGAANVLDVSDFDTNMDPNVSRTKGLPIITVEEGELEVQSSSQDSQSERAGKVLKKKQSQKDLKSVVVSQKNKLRKWLKIAQSHDKSAETTQIHKLLIKIKTTGKPLKKAELKDLQILEALDLPYATRNSIPAQRPLSNDKFSTNSSARSKSKGRPKDPARINELYMVYSNARPKRLNSIEVKKAHAGHFEGPVPLEAAHTVAINRVLPPLKAAGLTVPKKPTEQEQDSMEPELASNKHLAKIDKIIGQCFDKVRKSFNKPKPRQSQKNLDKHAKDPCNLALVEQEHKIHPPRRSMSRADAQLFKLAN